MKTNAWQVHVLRTRRIIERARNIGHASRIPRIESAPVSGGKKHSPAPAINFEGTDLLYRFVNDQFSRHVPFPRVALEAAYYCREGEDNVASWRACVPFCRYMEDPPEKS
jgi:hypothetical protein